MGSRIIGRVLLVSLILCRKKELPYTRFVTNRALQLEEIIQRIIFVNILFRFPVCRLQGECCQQEERDPTVHRHYTTGKH